jgi:hypothetical protein
MKDTIFWNVKPCRLINVYKAARQHIPDNCNLHNHCRHYLDFTSLASSYTFFAEADSVAPIKLSRRTAALVIKETENRFHLRIYVSVVGGRCKIIWPRWPDD